MCSLDCCAEFTCGTCTSRPGKNKAYYYGFSVSGYRLSAGKKRSFSQQQSRKLHGEMWASLLDKQGPWIFREEEIVSGCAVLVACPSCPDHSPEPPLGPGRIIRNMLGWSQMEKTVRSGSMVVPWCPPRRGVFFSSLDAARRLGKERDRTTQRGRSLVIPRVLVRTRTGQGPASGPCTGQRCWPLLAGVWRAIAP